jgi:hypothetical protein
MLEPYRAMPVKNTDTATWLEASIEKPWGRGDNANYAAAIIPRGFKSYARLLHPGYTENGGREVSWSEVAEHFMRKPHAQMQWHAITKSHHSDISSVGFKAPNTGSLPQNQAKVLVEILRKHTSTPQDCYFAIWDGWGFFVSDELQSETAYLKLPHRAIIWFAAQLKLLHNPYRPCRGRAQAYGGRETAHGVWRRKLTSCGHTLAENLCA